MKRTYALDVHLENTVLAFLVGCTEKVTRPNEQMHLIHKQDVNPHTQVYVGEWHLLHQELKVSSGVNSACALQGVKASDIVQALLKMRLHVDGSTTSAVVVDYNCKGVITPAVTSLEAVYVACRYVLKKKVLKQHKELPFKIKAVKSL